MNLWAWYIIFRRVRVNSARLLRRSALPQGWVSIRQNNSLSSQIRMKSIVDSSRCWMDNTLKWASTERQQLLALHLGNCMGCAATLRHNRAIGRLSRQNLLQQHRYYVLKMSSNGASTIFSFASSVSYVPISCRHPFMGYWQPLQTKTTARCSLRHPENERQPSVNSFRTCILRNQGIAQIFVCVTVLLTTLLGKNSIYRRWNTDTKSIDITHSSTSNSTLLVAENAILIRYY